MVPSKLLLVFCVLLVALRSGCLGSINERITNGEEAPPHQFPHLVSIVWGIPPIINYKHICGGAILNKNWILTAAHCVIKLPLIGHKGVQAGKHIINKQETGQQFSGIARKIVHSKYRGCCAENDIALLKLKTPLDINDIVAPIKLPSNGKIHTGLAVVSGWGSTSNEFWPKYPKILQTATTPIVDNKKCWEALHELPGDPRLFNTQMCTGPIGGTVSACLGDGGGPLVQYDDKAVPELAGIVSWGAYPCGSGAPSVYTRVSSYIDWINQKID